MLVEGLPVRVRREQELGARQAALRAVASGLPRDHTVRVRCGTRGTAQRVKIDELLRRWADGRSRISVTDLHIRGTGVVRKIDCTPLSDSISSRKQGERLATRRC